MALPPTDEFRRPTLEALDADRPMQNESIHHRVQAILGVSDEDRATMPVHSPTPIFTNYVAWALVDLQARGLIEKTSSTPNTYKISAAGRDALDRNVDLTSIARRSSTEVADESRAAGAEDTAPAGDFEQERPPRPFASRPFDPERPPQPADFQWKELDPEATAQLVEKARMGHHRILVNLHRWLGRGGWSEIGEVPGSIDLWAVDPAGRRWLFEAKTIRADTELSQTRGGMAQLLEYRVTFGSPGDGVALVVDAAITPARSSLLEKLGIALLRAGEDGVESLNGLWPGPGPGAFD